MDYEKSRFKKLEELDFNDLTDLSIYIKRLEDNFYISMNEEDYIIIRNALRHILEIMEKDNGNI